VVEIHESVRGPEFFLQLLARYHLAGVLDQHGQDLKGLFLKPDAQPVLTQFPGTKIQFENSKAEP
jgi:hypothetical protein